jgi:hypothetical protein
VSELRPRTSLVILACLRYALENSEDFESWVDSQIKTYGQIREGDLKAEIRNTNAVIAAEEMA